MIDICNEDTSVWISATGLATYTSLLSLLLNTQAIATLLSVRKCNRMNENNQLRCLINLHPISAAVSSSFGMVNQLD